MKGVIIMNIKSKRAAAMITALCMASTVLGSMSVFAADSTEYTKFPYVAECEDLELSDGMDVWTSIYETQLPGYSGDGFVYLTNGTVTMKVTVPEDGMYHITTKYAQILDKGGRQQTISINGATYKFELPYADKWTDFDIGVYRLKAGENTIQLLPQYGYGAYDTITIEEAQLPELNVQPTLSDSKATKETQSLMNYLCDVYGKNILSGQQEIYGNGHDGDMEYEFKWIENLTGKLPAIRGFDFMNYNPLYGWDDETTERIIEWTNEKGGIATACWHINIPSDFDSYEVGEALDWEKCTYKPVASFDTSKAVVEGTKENQYLMLAIEDLAEQLLRLQDANVPIILRPFHEAEGNGGVNGEGAWFWWGTGGAETYKELWKLLYNTLTEDYGLHNIIWQENLYTWSPASAEWYVGDDYVDMVGYDKYNVEYNRTDGLSNCPNEDAISSIFYKLVDFTGNKKLVAMPENDTVPSIENMKIEKAGWLYFCPWYGDHLMDEKYNYKESLIDIYNSDYTITLDELPDWKTYESGGTTPAETTTSVAETTVSETKIVNPQLIFKTGTVTEIKKSTIIVEFDDGVTAEIITPQESYKELLADLKTGDVITATYINTDDLANPVNIKKVSSSETTVSETTEGTTGSGIGTPTLLGDVTCDGDIDVRDVTLLNQYIVKMADLSEDALANADVISDGTVDLKDLGQLKKFLIKVIDKF